MSRTIDLSGKWEFTYRPDGREPGSACPDEFPGFMMIPGYWDDHYELFDYTDDFDRTAKFNPEYRPLHFPMGEVTPDASMPFLVGSGYYRKKLILSNVSGREIFLQLGAAVWGSELFCNGKSAGFHPGYSTTVTHRLTGLLREGENELVIAVSNARCGGARETHNGQHRGLAVRGFKATRAGIADGVRLKISGSAAISDHCAALRGEEIEFRAVITGSGASQLVLHISGNGVVLEEQIPVPADGNIVMRFPAGDLPRWSDRHPQLCNIGLRLLDAAMTELDRVDGTCGLAGFSCSATRVLVNGIPTFMRGSTEHCYFPESCNPHWDIDKYLHDLGVLKSAGFNFMRCHTWCPPEPFFTACDQLGLIVQVEVPPHTGTPEWDAILNMVRRHVSAAILCGGNEENLTFERIEGLRSLHGRMKALAPWMLFNPHEALATVEYRIYTMKNLPPGDEDPADICEVPFRYNKRKLDKLAEFSDLYGNFLWGFASYGSDIFPGSDGIEARLAVYGKPALAHEAGILGGYLNPDLESRYRNTYISPELYETARTYMERKGVSLEQFREYYRLNSLFIASLRKQLLENLRSCPSLGGYDFLGGQDSHWHRCGYPCGVFNEFYEEKPGESAQTFLRCNGESILICAANYKRNFTAGSEFSTSVSLSCFSERPRVSGTLSWEFVMDGFSRRGEIVSGEIEHGSVVPLGEITFTLPPLAAGKKALLKCAFTGDGIAVENDWEFWCFPEVQPFTGSDEVKIVSTFSSDEAEFVQNGGKLLVVDGFPCDRTVEMYKACPTGRSSGHYGNYVKTHPALANFPHDGYLTWQAYDMMFESRAMLFAEESLLPFAPVIGLIPSYKKYMRKAMLAEYKTGKGRMIFCAFNLTGDDPAAQYLKSELLRYLADGNFTADAPELSPETVALLVSGNYTSHAFRETDIACDPNVQ
ncbi:MAG: hypothetical protein IKC89_05740 [Lentisphaeria bacterium]|nr:hypothetical protein [Lentisphaeria bacterium]